MTHYSFAPRGGHVVIRCDMRRTLLQRINYYFCEAILLNTNWTADLRRTIDN